MEINDDGYVNIAINGVEGSVDLWKAFNRLQAIHADARKRFPAPEEAARTQECYFDGVCAFLEELGFGAVSHRVADKFDIAIDAKVDEVKKADAPTPA